MSIPFTENLLAFPTAITTAGATTSGIIDLSQSQLKSIQFTSANTVGSAIFTVNVSNDGTNWVVYNRLVDNVVNGITEGDVRLAASSSLATATSKIYFFPIGDCFRYMTVTCTVTTGGSYQAIIETSC